MYIKTLSLCILILATQLLAACMTIRDLRIEPEFICPSCNNVNIIWDVNNRDGGPQSISASPAVTPPLGDVAVSGSESRRLCETTTFTLTAQYRDNAPKSRSETTVVPSAGGQLADIELDRMCNDRNQFIGWRGVQAVTRFAPEIVVLEVTNTHSDQIWLSHNGYGQLINRGETVRWPAVNPTGIWEAGHRGFGLLGCRLDGVTAPPAGFREAPPNLTLTIWVGCPNP